MGQSSHAAQVDPALLASARDRTRRKKSPRKVTPKPAEKPEGLSQQQLHKLDNQLLRITPSSPWRTDIRADVVTGKLPYKTKMPEHLDAKGIFPPGGRKKTLMRKCRKCGDRFFPPQYLTADKRVVKGHNEICTDCLEIGRAPRDQSERSNVRDGHAELADGGTTSSPVAVAVDALANQNAQLEEVKMLPEGRAELLKYIANYKATGELAV